MANYFNIVIKVFRGKGCAILNKLVIFCLGKCIVYPRLFHMCNSKTFLKILAHVVHHVGNVHNSLKKYRFNFVF